MKTLFPISDPLPKLKPELHQWLTPRWAAVELVDRFFGDLTPDDLVLEPTCGDGSFVEAIPPEVGCIGVEIDPVLAEHARANTGRRIICGDFRTIELPEKPTAMVGNPPFDRRLLDELLDRARHWLPDNGRCGLILSTHMVQTPSTVLRWNEHWSMEQHIMPRTLFPRAIRPLLFLMFTKDRQHKMLGGFALYREAADIQEMENAARLLLIKGKPGTGCWRAVVEWALRRLGGKARLDEIYAAVSPRRPTGNPWWREKVRQTLQRHFVSPERGVWAMGTQ